MLIIRDAQQASLAARHRATFDRALLGFIHEQLPEYVAEHGEDGARALLTTAVERARRYGIERCCDVARYMAFMAVFGWDFDTNPGCAWAQEILRDTSRAPSQRLANLLQRALAELSPAPSGAP